MRKRSSKNWASRLHEPGNNPGKHSTKKHPLWERDLHSDLVDYLRAHDYTLRAGDLEVRLARAFGFCYGVARAVEYAYQTRQRFPDRRIFITGQIIHNPFVNQRLQEMGIRYLDSETLALGRAPLAAGPRPLAGAGPSRAGPGRAGPLGGEPGRMPIRPEDVVIIPAFGAPHKLLETLRNIGCVVVDTTCGSVLSVWKRVDIYAKEGFTTIIHGRYNHEETQATASQVLKHPGAHYLVVLNREEAQFVCDYIRHGGDPETFLRRFESAVSPGFDPERDLQKIGLVNQTTMLSSESLVLAEMFRQALIDRYGSRALEKRFRSFDTICRATQDRQDAVVELAQGGNLDLMLVIGGYNSSNTKHLAKIASSYVPTYHIEDAGCLLGTQILRHQPVGSNRVEVTEGWLPKGKVTIGLTAGASTPDSLVGKVIERLLEIKRVKFDF